MLPLISIGIVAGSFLGLLSLAVAGKLYHLLCCKRNPVTSNKTPDEVKVQSKQRTTDDAVWLFCWRKSPPPEHNATVDEDLEMGLGDFNELSVKSIVEEGVEAELMRLHNLCGPPRFLFTIKEETVEDLASDDGKPTSTRLIDLMRAADETFLTPIASPVKKNMSLSSLLYSDRFMNPLFECSAEAELNRIMSSPPPKFKFLRDAEAKLQKKLEDERQVLRPVNSV